MGFTFFRSFVRTICDKRNGLFRNKATLQNYKSTMLEVNRKSERADDEYFLDVQFYGNRRERARHCRYLINTEKMEKEKSRTNPKHADDGFY